MIEKRNLHLRCFQHGVGPKGSAMIRRSHVRSQKIRHPAFVIKVLFEKGEQRGCVCNNVFGQPLVGASPVIVFFHLQFYPLYKRHVGVSLLYQTMLLILVALFGSSERLPKRHCKILDKEAIVLFETIDHFLEHRLHPRAFRRTNCHESQIPIQLKEPMRLALFIRVRMRLCLAIVDDARHTANHVDCKKR